MKLKCRVVRFILAGICKGEPLPRWVEAHIEQCEKCRREASACQVMGTVLGTECVANECTVAWADVKDRLGERRLPARRRSLAAFAAATACVVVIGVAVAMALSPGDGPVRREKSPMRVVRKSPVKQIPRAARNDGNGAGRNDGDGAVRNDADRTARRVGMDRSDGEHAVKQAPKRVGPRRIRRPVVKPSESSLPDPSLMASNKAPRPRDKTDPPKLIAIVPEEHVIGVVGVTIDRDNNNDYVIREVSASDARACAAKL